MGYRLAPQAASDIDEIWDYTCDRWGVDQADLYVGQIRDTVTRVAREPGLDRPCDDIRQGYFRATVQSHIIFYRRAGDDIEIIRVLHGRMDFRRHLT